MYDFALIFGGHILSEPDAGETPQFGQEVVVDDAVVLDLGIQTGQEAKFCFCATISLHDGSLAVTCPTRNYRDLPGSCQTPLVRPLPRVLSGVSSPRGFCTGALKESFRTYIPRVKSQR